MVQKNNTNTTNVVTSSYPTNEEKIVESLLNYQIILAKRLSKAFSNGQENPVLENFLLNEVLKCLLDLNNNNNIPLVIYSENSKYFSCWFVFQDLIKNK